MLIAEKIKLHTKFQFYATKLVIYSEIYHQKLNYTQITNYKESIILHTNTCMIFYYKIFVVQ